MNLLKVSIFSLCFMVSAVSFANDLKAYKSFGEKKGLTKIVDDFMNGLLADKRMNPFFKNVDKKRTKEKLVEQFCKELGGPCEYTGQSMYRSHKGHVIKEQHFFALVEVLQSAMAQNKVPNWAQNKLISKLAPMHKDIINE